MTRNLTVFVLAFLFLVYKTWAYPLIDADEPRYAEAAKEMINAHQYLIPLADGLPRFDKPILFYWFEILSFKALGINEFAARLPSVIAGALTVTFIYWFGRFYQIGISVALILITSLEFFVISRMSITDSLLNFCIVATLVLYFLIKEKHIDPRYIYLLAFCVALGFLTKGPIAILIPVMVVVLYTYVTGLLRLSPRNDGWAGLPRSIPSLATMFKAMTIFILITAPWYIAIHFKTGGEFTQYFFIEQNLGRYSSTLSGHHQPWWFYIAVTIIGFMPWSLFLPAVIANLKFQATNLRLQSFALIWLFTVVGFFSFSSTKLANYVMSIFVPLAILFALYFKESLKKKWLLANCLTYVFLFAGLLILYSQGYWDLLCTQEAFLKNYVPNYLLLTILVLLLVAFIGIAFNIVLANRHPAKRSFASDVDTKNDGTMQSMCSANGDNSDLRRKSNDNWAIKIFVIVALGFCFIVANYFIVPFANYKEAGIKSFVQQIPKDTQIYLLTIDRPSVSFYSQGAKFPKRIGMKKLKVLANGIEQFCLIAKHDKAEKLAKLKQLVNWSQDDIYLFTCNFKKKEPAD